jgi:hypothetical protein
MCKKGASMSTTAKIRIEDNFELRDALNSEYLLATQHQLSKFGAAIVEHVKEMVEFDEDAAMLIERGLLLNKQWQNGSAAVFEVWQVGLEIYKKAREYQKLIDKTALGAVSQAIASIQMNEHAMVATDFAVRLVRLLNPNDENAVEQERQWQLNCLKNLKAA